MATLNPAPVASLRRRIFAFRILTVIPVLLAVAVATLEVWPPRISNDVILAASFALPFLLIFLLSLGATPKRMGLAGASVMGVVVVLIGIFTLDGAIENWKGNGRPVVAVLGAITVAGLIYLWLSVSLYRKLYGPGKAKFLLHAGVFSLVLAADAALVMPELLRSCCGSLESPAVGNMRTINTAEVTYATTYPDIGFADLRVLGGIGGSSAASAGLIDDVLANGRKSGYVFTVKAGAGTPSKTYISTARPEHAGAGGRAFCSDESGVIRYVEDGDAEHCVVSGVPLR
jgi:hypothetical protein